MKVLISLFHAFNFFKFGLAKPLFSLKPIIIFANFNPRKKDWETHPHFMWSPALCELERALNPSEPAFYQAKFTEFKAKNYPKFEGLFELSNFGEKRRFF